MKYTLIVFTSLLLLSACKKPTQNDIVAQSFLGDWETSSFIVNSVEQNSNSTKEIFTFFDIKNSKGFVHLKKTNQTVVLNEIEGIFEVVLDGTVFSIEFLNDEYIYNIEKIQEDSFFLTTTRVKNGVIEEIKYRAKKID